MKAHKIWLTLYKYSSAYRHLKYLIPLCTSNKLVRVGTTSCIRAGACAVFSLVICPFSLQLKPVTMAELIGRLDLRHLCDIKFFPEYQKSIYLHGFSKHCIDLIAEER
jgi:hypothetical protein